MKKRYIPFICLTLLSSGNIVCGQIPIIAECHQHLIYDYQMFNSSESVSCTYNDIWTTETANDTYIPNENSPNYTVRLNLHIMQEDDGSGNFQDVVYDRNFLSQLIDNVNTIYTTNHQPIWNGLRDDSYIVDSKICFRVDGVYFHKNSSVCHLKPYNESTSSDVYFNQYGVDIEHSINIFFSELLTADGDPYVNISGNGFGLNGESRNCVGMYSYYYQYSNNTGAFNAMVFTLAHELGHALGLMHTYQPDEVSDTYLPDVGGWCNCNTDINCSNNMMGGASWREHFSPRQMGKMRRLMTVGWRAKIVDNCLHNEPLMNITSNQTWDRPRLFSSDITVNNGATVTSYCKIYLPQQKKITVDENSKLIIDGGCILNVCNEPVSIQVNQGGYLEIKGSAVLDNCNVNIQNGGSLKLSGNVILKNGSNINLLSGSYFCFTSGANLNFVDNSTALNLYHDHNIGVNAIYFPGSSSNCMASVDLLNYSGSGLINDYNADVYIQNETISADKYITGKNIYVGKNVTSLKPAGDVLITNNANVIFDAAENVYFEPGFECELGASFEVK